ncbi:hypothetical protein VME_46980 [Vibrio harveyi 1DA3]|nr:hypothetical protein VME_46980 [Vibrio harveyi 1DA3]
MQMIFIKAYRIALYTKQTRVFLYAPNPEDKRSQCLLTTEKGNEVLSKLKAVDAEIFLKMTLNVSEEELEAFQLVAGKLAENLSKNPS